MVIVISRSKYADLVDKFRGRLREVGVPLDEAVPEAIKAAALGQGLGSLREQAALMVNSPHIGKALYRDEVGELVTAGGEVVAAANGKVVAL